MPILDPESAWDRVRSCLTPLPAERLGRRRALGRVLATDIVATVDMPALDVSAMDGYAVGAAAHIDTPIVVTGTVVAGDPPGARLDAGVVSALRIMTGAPVPHGADRVIPVERAHRSEGGAEAVRFESILEPGANIRRRGEVVRAGQPLLGAETALTPSALALLASHGVGDVAVHGAPSVAVVSTGDEVVSPEEEPSPGQLRDSHTDFLLAAGRRLGLDFTSLGIAPDEPNALEGKLRAGLGADVLIVCGGVSVGEFDLVEGVLSRLGVRVLFDHVAVQPGQPMVAAVQSSNGRLVFGLPGNPASSIVCFHLFVRPALRVLLGHEDAFWNGALTARLDGPLPGAKARDRFLPALLEIRAGSAWATPIPPKGSHDLLAYGRGDGLVRVPAHADPRPPGESCEFLPI